MFAKFNAAVPVAGMLKSKVKVSHWLATVVFTSVSTVMVLLAASSTFNRTGIFASGDHTRTEILVWVAENGTAFAKPAFPIVTPAQVAAFTGFTTARTVLLELVGSVSM